MAHREITQDDGLTRRGLLTGGVGLTFSIALGGLITAQPDGVYAGAGASEQLIGGWVRIGADGVIEIVAPAAEGGQGVFTSLPQMIAEELDADWSKVKPVFPSTVDEKIYGNPGFYNMMYAARSISVDGFWEKIRIGGAQVRRVLMQAAADKWGVARSELKTEPSVVVHPASGQRLSYAEIATFATVPADLPKIDETDLKKPSEFRLIGQNLARVDIPSKVDGSATFGIDVQIPGMLYATLLRSPVEAATPQAIDDAAALKVPGVVRTVTLKDAVAIVGETVEAVFKARKLLEVTWQGGDTQDYDSERGLAEFAKRVKNTAEKGASYVKEGDADAALAEATKVVRAEYQADYVYHAQMEPINAAARVNEAGDEAEIWIGTQAPSTMLAAAVATLKTKPEKIRFHQHFYGGGYGRRSSSDMVPYVLLIAKEMKRPIKMIWTREQDVKAAKLRPMTAHNLEAGFNDKGDLIAWKHRLVGEAVTRYTQPWRWTAGNGIDPLCVDGSTNRYEIDNKSIEYLHEIRGVGLASWRGIGSGYNKFVIESFVDELAHAQKMDPIAFRLKLMAKQPRSCHILETTAKMANWGGELPEGRAMGVAFTDAYRTPTAGIADISIDRATGVIGVHRFWTAVDCGIVVNPDTVLQQTEGNILMGISSFLKERITFVNGTIQQSNFSDYPVLRMSEMPEMFIKIVPSDNHPTGIGEIALPLVGGAIANAVFTLTGRRLRHMPFTPERVKAALA
jgi:isoquinoline 1-oxidoreductase beta subunit